MKKILIIRFSSIGDIILTTPVLRILKKQKNAELHFLTKKPFACLLENNPYLYKIHIIDKYLDDDLLTSLARENFDLLIDLQKNVRSFRLKRLLKLSSVSFCKSNFKKWLLIKLNFRPYGISHVVDRYIDSLSSLGIKDDGQGLDYFIPAQIQVDFPIEQSFLAWSIGGSFEQKKLSLNQVVEVLSQCKQSIVLLGGKDEMKQGEDIIRLCKNPTVYNFCGRLSLNQTALMIQKSQLLLSNDTGLMHMGAAFKKPIISFWGCTQPSLGFAPYRTSPNSIEISARPMGRPCSKHGKYCRTSAEGCIKNISSRQIYLALEQCQE